jgi:hypothetical protein
MSTAAALARGPAVPLVSNRQRYRVRDANAGTGRSGSAQVTVRAMAGKDGKTVLDMTTGGLDAASAPRGELTKAQVKLLDPDNLNHALATVNYAGLTGGTFTMTYVGLVAGLPLQIQANVKGADGNRTDVVTITERVKRRPDLAVALGRIAGGRTHVPAEIVATIRELNGDLGATGTCVLSVDGVAVDRATGIWVDAGDAVSCAFMHTFATAGPHAVTVRIDGVVPGDWDTANNEAAGAISIVDPVVEPSSWGMFAYQAALSQSGQLNGYSRSLESPTSPAYWEQSYARSYATHIEERAISLNGWGPEFVSFPLQSFEVSFSTDGRLLQTASVSGPIAPTEAFSFGDPTLAYSQACLFRMDESTALDGGAAGRIYVSICSYEQTNDGGTNWTRGSNVFVQQYAGSVTYWSAEFVERRFKDADGTLACYPGECYTSNTAQNITVGAPPYLALGSQARASFGVIGANGVHLALDKTVFVTQLQQGSDLPYGCSDYVDPNLQYFSHYCAADTYRYTWRGGESFSF